MAEVRRVGQRVTYDLVGLTEEEIALIYTYVMNTGGPMDTPRKYAEGLRSSLDAALADDSKLYDLFDDFASRLTDDPMFGEPFKG